MAEEGAAEGAALCASAEAVETVVLVVGDETGEASFEEVGANEAEPDRTVAEDVGVEDAASELAADTTAVEGCNEKDFGDDVEG